MELLQFVQSQMGLFILIFARISGIFSLAPVYGSRNTPLIVKAGLSILLSLIVLPMISPSVHQLPTQFFPFALALIYELLMGLILGFTSFLIFQSVQMAGHFLDIQIGFGIVNIMDPQFGQQVPLIGSFKYLLAVIIFLVTNGHHLLLSALVQSFGSVPLLQVTYSAQLVDYMITLVATSFVVAFKIALPVAVSLLLTDVSMAIMSKTIPQINIFVIGIPIKITVGIFVLMVGLPFFLFMLNGMFETMAYDVQTILLFLQPGGQ